MASETEEEKFESIERWLESVSGEPSPTTHGKVTDEQETQDQPHLQPTCRSHPQSSSLSIYPLGLASKLTRRRKKASSSPRASPGPAKRRARSVRFSENEETSHSGHSHSTALSARKLRVKLRRAKPPVSFSFLESKHKAGAVTALLSNLIDELEEAVPVTLRNHVKKLEIGATATVRGMDERDAQTWKLVRETMKTASTTFERASDENGWTNVVFPLLQQTLRNNDQEGNLLEVMDIRTVSIGPPSLIPTVADEPLAFKKVDLAIIFSDSEPDLNMLYSKIMEKDAVSELCQSEDPTLCEFCQFGAIEVKSPDGSYYGASVQLAIWLAAGLEKTRQLRKFATAKDHDHITRLKAASQEEPLLPNVGISVNGHVWNLHVAWKGIDGAVQIYGPLIIGDTATTRGVFGIIAAFRYLQSWAENTYYPWLLKEILLPLAEKDESSLVGLSKSSATEAESRSDSNVKGKGKQQK